MTMRKTTKNHCQCFLTACSRNERPHYTIATRPEISVRKSVVTDSAIIPNLLVPKVSRLSVSAAPASLLAPTMARRRQTKGKDLHTQDRHQEKPERGERMTKNKIREAPLPPPDQVPRTLNNAGPDKRVGTERW